MLVYLYPEVVWRRVVGLAQVENFLESHLPAQVKQGTPVRVYQHSDYYTLILKSKAAS